MSSWEDELDIDDSDILGVFRRVEPSPAASLPRPQRVANPPVSCSSADPLQAVASGVLSRFQKPRTSQASFRNATRNLPHAVEELDGFDLDPLGKRKRDANTDDCSNLPSLPATMAKYGEIQHREASQFGEVQALGEDNTSGDAGGRHGANSSDLHCRSSPQSMRRSQEATDLLHRKKTVCAGASPRLHNTETIDQPLHNDRPQRGLTQPSKHASYVPNAGRSSLPRAETATPELRHGEERERSESHNTRSLPLQKDLPYQIPGPAGAVQRGLAREIHHCIGGNRVTKDNSAPRTGTESGASVVDDVDFRSAPWRGAMNYIEKACLSISTIKAIKISRTENRIPKLVAVIKTCSPNGCGDVLVNLKDPSDAIGGTINRRVMTETEFGRLIEPGAVILLHQVAVFSPTPYAHYLNITINNVEQVFGKSQQVSQEKSSDAAGEGHMNSLHHDPSQLEQRAEELCGQPMSARQRTSTGSQIIKNLRAEDDMYVPSDPAFTTRGQQIHTEVDLDSSDTSLHSGQDNACSQLTIPHARNRRASICSAPVCPNDVYDQLLDDTDLFRCLQVRPSVQ